MTGDRIQLQQVSLNLITNAIHSMAAKDGARVLRARSEVHEGIGVIVSVANIGTGIGSQEFERISFSRAVPARSASIRTFTDSTPAQSSPIPSKLGAGPSLGHLATGWFARFRRQVGGKEFRGRAKQPHINIIRKRAEAIGIKSLIHGWDRVSSSVNDLSVAAFAASTAPSSNNRCPSCVQISRYLAPEQPIHVWQLELPHVYIIDPAGILLTHYQISNEPSGAGSATIWLQRGLEAIDQGRSGKGLAQEANGSGLHRPGANALLGKSGNEDERRTVTAAAHKGQQVQTAHDRHLYIRNDARRVMLLTRPQELFGRGEGMDDVPVRRQKIVRRGSNGLIIVNDGNYQESFPTKTVASWPWQQGARARNARTRSKDGAARQDCKIYIGLYAGGFRTTNTQRLRPS